MLRKKRRNYVEKLNRLEREGKFDEYSTPFNTEDVVPVDKNYVFLQKGAMNGFLTGVVRAVLWTLGPVADFLCFRLIVKGRKNLRKVKGAITVSNHVSYLDTLIVKETFGFGRVYLTGASHNSKRGVGGKILRLGGFLPLNGTFEAYKNLDAAISELLKKGKFVHFNPEQAMWVDYEKPRPMKIGAFRFAVKNTVPVVPMFIQFRKSRVRRAVGVTPAVTVQVMPPLYGNPDLPVRERAEDLRKRTEAAYRAQYEKYYKRKLTYLNEEGAADSAGAESPANSAQADKAEVTEATRSCDNSVEMTKTAGAAGNDISASAAGAESPANSAQADKAEVTEAARSCDNSVEMTKTAGAAESIAPAGEETAAGAEK